YPICDTTIKYTDPNYNDVSHLFFFFLLIQLPPRSTLFPYTTLFRSMQHPFEGCEQPGVSPAYTLLGKRIVQHIDEGGRTGAVGHLAFVRQRGDKERTIATDREERSRASGINERAAGNLDLAHELPRARVHDSERLRRGIVVDEQETIIVGQGLGTGHGHDRCSLR